MTATQTETPVTIARDYRGELHVHRTGCADLTKRQYFGYDRYDEAYASVQELVSSWFDGHMQDDGVDPSEAWENYVSEFRFFPCVKLPRT